MAKWIINGVIVVVVLMWAATIVADIILPDYNPPPQAHLAMMAIVGALFGKQVIGKAYEDEDKRNGPPPFR